MKPRLLYYEILKYQPQNLKLLHENFEVFTFPDPSHDRPEILCLVETLLAPLGYYVGKEKIDSAPKLRVIGSNTTGHPHIDVEYAAKKGVKVVTLKGQNKFLQTITPTAEMTWGLIIVLTRNIVPAYRDVLKGKWDRRPFGGVRMLSRMSLGVAGYGRLGRIVAHYGLCFGMKVIYYDPFVDEHKPRVKRVHSLEELVAESDITTVHIPHDPGTENLFNEDIFKKFKKGSYFINTSRGEIVDHTALLKALKNGTLAGAALDVFESEFVPEFQIDKHPIWKYATKKHNVIITPHIGGSTIDAWSLTEEFTIQKIIEALAANKQ